MDQPHFVQRPDVLTSSLANLTTDSAQPMQLQEDSHSALRRGTASVPQLRSITSSEETTKGPFLFDFSSSQNIGCGDMVYHAPAFDKLSDSEGNDACSSSLLASAEGSDFRSSGDSVEAKFIPEALDSHIRFVADSCSDSGAGVPETFVVDESRFRARGPIERIAENQGPGSSSESERRPTMRATGSSFGSPSEQLGIGSGSRVKLLCSFGGAIMPRPGDGKLRYVGGDTKLRVFDRHISYSELIFRITEQYNQAVTIKYQLPGEDLDSLVSVSSGEDLANMFEEYDELDARTGTARLKVFLFPAIEYEVQVQAARTSSPESQGRERPERPSDAAYVDAINGKTAMPGSRGSRALLAEEEPWSPRDSQQGLADESSGYDEFSELEGFQDERTTGKQADWEGEMSDQFARRGHSTAQIADSSSSSGQSSHELGVQGPLNIPTQEQQYQKQQFPVGFVGGKQPDGSMIVASHPGWEQWPGDFQRPDNSTVTATDADMVADRRTSGMHVPGNFQIPIPIAWNPADPMRPEAARSLLVSAGQQLRKATSPPQLPVVPSMHDPDHDLDGLSLPPSVVAIPVDPRQTQGVLYQDARDFQSSQQQRLDSRLSTSPASKQGLAQMAAEQLLDSAQQLQEFNGLHAQPSSVLAALPSSSSSLHQASAPHSPGSHALHVPASYVPGMQASSALHSPLLAQPQHPVVPAARDNPYPGRKQFLHSISGPPSPYVPTLPHRVQTTHLPHPGPQSHGVGHMLRRESVPNLPTHDHGAWSSPRADDGTGAHEKFARASEPSSEPQTLMSHHDRGNSGGFDSHFHPTDHLVGAPEQSAESSSLHHFDAFQREVPMLATLRVPGLLRLPAPGSPFAASAGDVLPGPFTQHQPQGMDPWLQPPGQAPASPLEGTSPRNGNIPQAQRADEPASGVSIQPLQFEMQQQQHGRDEFSDYQEYVTAHQQHQKIQAQQQQQHHHQQQHHQQQQHFAEQQQQHFAEQQQERQALLQQQNQERQQSQQQGHQHPGESYYYQDNQQGLQQQQSQEHQHRQQQHRQEHLQQQYHESQDYQQHHQRQQLQQPQHQWQQQQHQPQQHQHQHQQVQQRQEQSHVQQPQVYQDYMAPHGPGNENKYFLQHQGSEVQYHQQVQHTHHQQPRNHAQMQQHFQQQLLHQQLPQLQPQEPRSHHTQQPTDWEHQMHQQLGRQLLSQQQGEQGHYSQARQDLQPLNAQQGRLGMSPPDAIRANPVSSQLTLLPARVPVGSLQPQLAQADPNRRFDSSSTHPSTFSEVGSGISEASDRGLPMHSPRQAAAVPMQVPGPDSVQLGFRVAGSPGGMIDPRLHAVATGSPGIQGMSPSAVSRLPSSPFYSHSPIGSSDIDTAHRPVGRTAVSELERATGPLQPMMQDMEQGMHEAGETALGPLTQSSGLSDVGRSDGGQRISFEPDDSSIEPWMLADHLEFEGAGILEETNEEDGKGTTAAHPWDDEMGPLSSHVETLPLSPRSQATLIISTEADLKASMKDKGMEQDGRAPWNESQEGMPAVLVPRFSSPKREDTLPDGLSPGVLEIRNFPATTSSPSEGQGGGLTNSAVPLSLHAAAAAGAFAPPVHPMEPVIISTVQPSDSAVGGYPNAANNGISSFPVAQSVDHNSPALSVAHANENPVLQKFLQDSFAVSASAAAGLPSSLTSESSLTGTLPLSASPDPLPALTPVRVIAPGELTRQMNAFEGRGSQEAAAPAVAAPSEAGGGPSGLVAATAEPQLLAEAPAEDPLEPLKGGVPAAPDGAEAASADSFRASPREGADSLQAAGIAMGSVVHPETLPAGEGRASPDHGCSPLPSGWSREHAREQQLVHVQAPRAPEATHPNAAGQDSSPALVLDTLLLNPVIVLTPGAPVSQLLQLPASGVVAKRHVAEDIAALVLGSPLLEVDGGRAGGGRGEAPGGAALNDMQESRGGAVDGNVHGDGADADLPGPGDRTEKMAPTRRLFQQATETQGQPAASKSETHGREVPTGTPAASHASAAASPSGPAGCGSAAVVASAASSAAGEAVHPDPAENAEAEAAAAAGKAEPPSVSQELQGGKEDSAHKELAEKAEVHGAAAKAEQADRGAIRMPSTAAALTSGTSSDAEAEALHQGLQSIHDKDLEQLRELGAGTYGTVFHGKWRGTDVAIKRIKASVFQGRPSEQDKLIADFWREASILSNLHHPNVVAFYGVVRGGPDGSLATVTEFMPSGSLKQVLQRRDRSIDRRKRLLIAMDAAFGMEYLHQKNIVHFDLKCDNLLVNLRDPQRPICKVGDLGLSKVKHKTMVSGGVRGTLPWMAPELLDGRSALVTEKVDVFSFGIVMWELLTGEEPYANMHYGAIIGGIMSNSLRPPIPGWCDPQWRALMQRCWSGDANERPSFKEIANELRVIASPTK